MTVTTDNNKIVHVSDGVQTVFAYDFLVFDEAHLKVYEDTEITTKAFTVSGIGNPAGGDVTFSPDPPSSTENQLTILRVVPLTQEVDYQPFDDFPAETHETALDLGTMADQQLEEEQSRAASAPIGSDPDVDYTLPVYDAGKGIMWNETEKEFTNSEDNLNGITGAAQASADAAAGSASSASGSATAASGSASAALGSENKANEWAEKAEDDPVETGPDQFSALHHAAKAAETAANIGDLNSLSDVEVGSVADGDALVFDSGSGDWIPGSSGGPSLGTEAIIRINADSIAENITIPAGTNGSTVGPVEIEDGFTVTVEGEWVIL